MHSALYRIWSYAGGTGPATLAGNLICANAEILNAFVLCKAVNKEVPLIYASWRDFLI